MIRSLFSLLLLAASIFYLSACTKASDTKATEDNCQLLTVNYSSAPSQAYNIMMENGHVVQLTMTSDPQNRHVYTYNTLGQLVKREDFHNNDNQGANLVRVRWEHYYDASGKMVKTVMSNQCYTGGVPTGLYVNSIDSLFYTNGSVTEIHSYSPFNGADIYQGKTLLTWSNGDLISIINYNASGNEGHSFNYSYGAKENELDKLLPGFYIQETGEYGTFEGLRRSKHILMSATEKYTPSSTPIVTTYGYNYTMKGNLRSVQAILPGNTSYAYQFGYSCD